MLALYFGCLGFCHLPTCSLALSVMHVQSTAGLARQEVGQLAVTVQHHGGRVRGDDTGVMIYELNMRKTTGELCLTKPFVLGDVEKMYCCNYWIYYLCYKKKRRFSSQCIL